MLVKKAIKRHADIIQLDKMSKPWHIVLHLSFYTE